ncbi:MAG: PQQ-binding-like beta-propeller repeat protein [Pyrinomonadaceae bacterium]|nr:PQQ-binding-like beta-propeller repeat protein [Pyrinomonadaceae bacterium]
MDKISKTIFGYLLLFWLAQFPLVSWAQAKSIWVKPLQQCWVFPSSNMTSLKTASDNEKTILLPTSQGEIVGIDISKGQAIWKTKIGETFDSEIFVDGQSLLVAGSETAAANALGSTPSPSMLSINIDSGIASSLIPNLRLFDSEGIFIESNGGLVVIAERNGNIYAFNKALKEVLWRKTFDLGFTTRPKLLNSRLYVGSSNRTVIVLSVIDGEMVGQIPIGKTPSDLLLSDSALYVGDQLGGVRSISLSTYSEIWKTKTGGGISEIAAFEDVILVSSNDNFEYAISKKSGKKVWKRKLAGRILGKALVESRIAAMVTHGSNIGLFIDLNDGAIVNRITLSKDDYFVSAPVFLSGKIVVPTNSGLIAYSPDRCSK